MPGGTRVDSGLNLARAVACHRYRYVVDLNTVKTVATWVIVGFVVVGLLSAIIVKKVIGKIISLVLAAAVVFFVWQQRGHVQDYANDVRNRVCTAEPSFFGIDVTLPDDWCQHS